MLMYTRLFLFQFPTKTDETKYLWVCNCKTTCSRKRTARSAGCPCRNAVANRCSTNCQSGTKKTCKNRAVEVQPVNRNPSAYARHQRAVEESQNEIQVNYIVKALSQDERENWLLIRVLSQGRGSLEYARDLLASASDPQSEPPEPEKGDDSWCICRVCRRMQDETENVCCRKRTCVISYVMFNNICLARGVLELAIRARCDIRAYLPDYSTQSYRKAVYRQYTLWKYGKLGRGNRRILLSCVVTMIRQSYPAPDGRYMGYRQS